MKTINTLLLLAASLPSVAQFNDTIVKVDGKVIPCTITLDNGLYLFYNDKKHDGESIEKATVSYFVKDAKRTKITESEGRTGFTWDLIIPSLQGDKDKLYSKTKLFISEYWKSAKDVISYDEKSEGVIVIKPSAKVELNYQANDHVWYFKYTATFMVKDGKARVKIENIYCDAAFCSSKKWPLLPIGSYPGYGQSSMSEDKYKEIMKELGDNLQSMVESYKAEMQKKMQSDW